MKNFTCILVVLLFFFIKSEAQITKGNWLLGGNAHFSSIKHTNENESTQTQRQIGFSPVLGKFLFDKFVVGLKPTFLHDVNISDDADAVVNHYRLGPLLRYYFLSDEKPFNLLIEGSYQYSITKTNIVDERQNVFSINGGPVLFLNNIIGLEFLFGYSRARTVDGEKRREALGLSIGLQVHLERENAN